MKPKKYQSLFSASVVVWFLTFMPCFSAAQNGRFGWQRFGFGVRDQPNAVFETPPSMMVNIKLLDDLARRMESRYGYELRFTGGCKDSVKLHRQMLSHKIKTDALVKMAQKACPKSIGIAAHGVLNSNGLLQDLCKDACVSSNVSSLIAKSASIAKQVYVKVSSDLGESAVQP